MSMDLKRLTTGGAGGYNDLVETINDNFQEVEDKTLQKITPNDLPIAGAELGGVKNGGNVTVNEDGTMTAPEPDGGIVITKSTFTIGDPRWGSADPEGVYSLTLPNAGTQFFGVFLEVSPNIYRVPIVDVEVNSENTIIKTMTKFAGYILQGTV